MDPKALAHLQRIRALASATEERLAKAAAQLNIIPDAYLPALEDFITLMHKLGTKVVVWDVKLQ